MIIHEKEKVFFLIVMLNMKMNSYLIRNAMEEDMILMEMLFMN